MASLVATYLAHALGLAPVAGDGAPVAAPPGTSAELAPTYDGQAATADAEQVMNADGPAYLAARGRLTEHPQRAAVALVALLDGDPPITSAQRNRLLHVLAEVDPSSLAERVTTLLRVGASSGAMPTEGAKTIDGWRAVLRDLKAVASPHLLALIRDDRLELELRRALVEDLVTIAPPSDFPGLLALAPSLGPELQRTLIRRLRGRARGRSSERQALLAAIDALLDGGDPALVPLWLPVRAGLDGLPEPWLARLRTTALSPQAAPNTRIWATLALTQSPADSQTIPTLEALARMSLATKPMDQHAEVLGRLALEALPPEHVQRLVQQYQLAHSDRPALAAIAWQHASLGARPHWWREALDNPWPQVRRAALGRIDGHCDPTLVRDLRQSVVATDGRSDELHRATILALGRCRNDRAFAALRAWLNDGDMSTDLSAEAGRQLVLHYGSRGADAVARQLARRPEVAYGQRLIAALARAEALPAYTTQVLLAWAAEQGPVAQAARDCLTRFEDN